jgi:EAL domain-containing protein (putative c-di-GMP-specific phosphodiesterase class I)
VETEQQLALLKSWGCGAAQGYYFAKPMGVEEVTILLRRGRIDGGSESPHVEPAIG